MWADDLLSRAAAVLLTTLIVYAADYARRARLLRRLPRTPPGAKLTHDLLLAAGRDHPLAVRLPGAHGVLITSPKLALRLLERESERVHRDTSAYLRYRSFLGGSLVLLPQSGSAHAGLRSALLPLFSGAAARRAHPEVLGCVDRFLEQLQAACEMGKDGTSKPLPLYRLLQRFTVDVTSAAFLAQHVSDKDARRLAALFEEWLDAPPPPMQDPPPDFARGCSRLWRLAVHARYSPVAALRRAMGGAPRDASPPSPDRLLASYRAMLSRLVDRQDEAEELREAADDPPPTACVLGALTRHAAASDDPVRDISVRAAAREVARYEASAQTAGLLFAGLNSAKELAALLTLAATHPALHDDARNEVDALLAGAAPEYADVAGSSPRLKLVAQIVSESLRLSPGIEHLRLDTTRELDLDGAMGEAGAGGGYVIPRGTRLVISPAMMHRHPLHWPQPCDKPRPELFTEAARTARADGCFLPFSAGPKGCPAGGFALLEMRMLLCRTLQRFSLTSTPGGGVTATIRARAQLRAIAEAPEPTRGSA